MVVVQIPASQISLQFTHKTLHNWHLSERWLHLALCFVPCLCIQGQWYALSRLHWNQLQLSHLIKIRGHFPPIYQDVVTKLFTLKTTLSGIFEPLLLHNPTVPVSFVSFWRLSFISYLSDNIKNGFFGFLYVVRILHRGTNRLQCSISSLYESC